MSDIPPEAAAALDAAGRMPGRIGELVARLGPAASLPGPDGGWSAGRIVLHLTAVDEQVWIPRFRQLADGGHPTWTWTEPDVAGLPEPDPTAAVAALGAARQALLDTIAALDEAGWARSGSHAVFGELDAPGLLREVVKHDEEHLASLFAASGSGAGG